MRASVGPRVQRDKTETQQPTITLTVRPRTDVTPEAAAKLTETAIARALAEAGGAK